VPARADTDAVASAISAAGAFDLEDRAPSLGAVVGAVRSADVWSVHPQARVVAAQPVVEVGRVGAAAPRPWSDGSAPLSGIRVLDLTRVLAGPIAARDLALAGAEVLRVDSPLLEETSWIHLDTGQGKRSTRLDLNDTLDRRVFESLLSAADVLLTGYRPGALSRFGLDPADLAIRHPGLVTGSVSAWGTRGPWAGRRGFDSIVQAVTGIAMLESSDGASPGALPVQALDHSSGHFLAAATTTGLLQQRKQGGSVDVQIALARVAHALLHSPDGLTPPATDAVPLPSRHRELAGSPRPLTYAPPVLAFDGAPDDYPVVGGAWGVDAPAWSASADQTERP
jgi:crotonobetainyl-CoA:carnitine CoA-transferase CaiB-like acyl-CoA transferase